jgi:DNA-binding NarL/FixJ family response regulator
MTEKIVTIFDASSGELVERQMTEDEVIFIQQVQAEDLARKESKLAARESALAKLAALGLTEEEIGAL